MTLCLAFLKSHRWRCIWDWNICVAASSAAIFFLLKTWINLDTKIFIHLSYLLLICGHLFSRALTPIPIIWTIRNFSISIWAGREDREDHGKLMDFWFPIIRETYPSERHSLFHSCVGARSSLCAEFTRNIRSVNFSILFLNISKISRNMCSRNFL